MSDDLFSKLFELFNQPGKVNWPLGKEAARNLAGEPDPIDPWLAEEYEQLIRVAQLTLTSGDQRGDIDVTTDPSLTDRRGWADTNLRAFEYFADPLADKLGTQEMLAPVVSAMLGMQMGALVGTMSHRVLGSFDARLPVAAELGPTIVVVNVEDMIESRNLDPRQLRLWVAFTELTTHGIWKRPGVRDRFQHLLDRFISDLQLPDSSLLERIGDFQDPEALQNLLEEPGGVTGLTAPPELEVVVDRLSGVLGVVEGFAAFTLEQVAADVLPDRDLIRRHVEERRSEGEGRQVLQQMMALDLGAGDPDVGVSFCRSVFDSWGQDGLAKLWLDPEHLPSRAELADPIGWAARVMIEDIGL